MDEKRLIVKPYKLDFRSPVSIIIPFYGEYELVAKLVESIWATTQTCPYEIILVDDASPNKTFIENFKGKPQIKTIRSEQRLGFGGALELGYKTSNQPWLVFLNSDCVVRQPNWLSEMGKTLMDLKSSNVRMVSARSDNPGEGLHPFLKCEHTESAQNVILSDGFLPLFCAMCHRELFSHIGGFIKNYYPGYYEDEELAYRMRKYGCKQAICGSVWVHHKGSATIERLCKTDPEAINQINNNRDRCLKDVQSLGR